MKSSFFPSPARGEGIKTRHSGSLEKLIEPEGEIKFFKLCGIAELKNLTTVRLRVVARNGVFVKDVERRAGGIKSKTPTPRRQGERGKGCPLCKGEVIFGFTLAPCGRGWHVVPGEG